MPSQVETREQFDTRVMVVIVRERGRHERTGVAEDHADRPKPSSNSSSLRAAVSVRLPDAAPNHGGGAMPAQPPVRAKTQVGHRAGTSASGSSSTSRRSSSRSTLMPTIVKPPWRLVLERRTVRIEDKPLVGGSLGQVVGRCRSAQR